MSFQPGLEELVKDSNHLFRSDTIQEHQGSFKEQTFYLISYKIQFTVGI